MRKRTVLTMTLMVAVLGLPGVAAAQDSAPNESYTIHGAARAVPRVTGSCAGVQPGSVVPIRIDVAGTSTLSRLGRAEFSVVETGLGVCVGAPVPAPVAVLTARGTYTAANGDELDFNSISSTPLAPVDGTPWFRFSSTDELLPTGTGRFADATGTLHLVVTLDPTTDPATAWFTVDGLITVPKG